MTERNERAERDDRSSGFSRRGFLGGAVGAAALTALDWSPAFRIAAASAATTIPAPPNFPAGISLYQQAFENWAKEIHVDGVWTCAPNTPDDVVTLANWAHANGYKLRPRGAMHGWMPLTIVPGSDISKVVLVDTTQHLTAVSVSSASSPATVTAQAGATIEAILTAAQAAGYGMVSVPAPGNITIGGALAIDAHGAALPANGETPIPGTTYGSLSNLVTSLTAVVWSSAQNQYVLKTFSRVRCRHQGLPHPPRPGLRHLGHVAAGGQLPAALPELVQHPDLGAVRAAGLGWPHLRQLRGRRRAGGGDLVPVHHQPVAQGVDPVADEAVLLPPGHAARTTTRSPTTSRRSVSDLLSKIVQGQASLTPSFGALQLSIVQTGLIATGTWDIWGWSKDLLFYIRPTTLRVSEGGAAILTTRANIQRVINEFTTWYSARLVGLPGAGPVPDERAGRDPLLRSRPAERREGGVVGLASALGGATPPRPPRVGHRGVAGRARPCRARPARSSSTGTWSS